MPAAASGSSAAGIQGNERNDRAPHNSDSIASEATQEIIVFPPGLLGEIARFIYGAAPYPNPYIALAGAIALMAALFGRCCNVSESGCNVWAAIIGETAIGKEAAQSGISKLISAAIEGCPGVVEFVGPSKWASQEAIHKRLVRTPSVVGFIGELGIKAKAWCAVNASSVASGQIAFTLDVYGKSGRGSMLYGQENSDREKGSEAVASPALSFLGDTTPEPFFEALDERYIANGWLPRWVIIHAGSKRSRRNKCPQSIPSPELVEAIKQVAAFSLGSQKSGNVIDVPLTSGADKLSDELEQRASGTIEQARVEVARHLWSRVHLNVLKIAALCTVGRAWFSGDTPVITEDDFKWAEQVVVTGVQRVLAKFQDGEVGEQGGNQTVQEKEVLRCINSWASNPFDNRHRGTYDMHRDGVITLSYFQQRLYPTAAFRNDRAGANAALTRTIKSLVDGDILREIPNAQMTAKYGKHPRAYCISDCAEVLNSGKSNV